MKDRLSSMNPLFSVVIPTRNRPHLLQYSLQSALEQRFDDFEVVVCDNSSNSTARQVVTQFDDGRLRYRCSGADLSMPDSWEFAYLQARGRYVSYLCDDDAYVPSLLEQIAAILGTVNGNALLVWKAASYFHPNWLEARERNRLVLPSCTGGVDECDSRESLEDLYRLGSSPKPMMLNSMCHRSLIDKIREKAGRVFFPLSPDYSFAALSLALTQSFVHVDRPLMIGGVARESIGMSHLYGDLEPVKEFLSEFRQTDRLPDVAASLPTVWNYVAQTLLNVQRQSGLISPHIRLDLSRYFSLNYEQLRSWETHGFDVRPAMAILRQALANQPDQVRATLADRMRRDTWRRLIRRCVIESPWLGRIEAAVRPALRAKPRAPSVDGSVHGFTNILECVRAFESLIEGRTRLTPRRS
jgi:glycosyltransferase involved in cell wall biosynthesis